MKVLLTNKNELALFVNGFENRVNLIELFCRMCTLSTHKDCRVNKFCFYVNNYTPSI